MAEKTKIEQYKKSEQQKRYEKDVILQPIKKLIPKAPSGRSHSIALPQYISFTIQENTKIILILILTKRQEF